MDDGVAQVRDFLAGLDAAPLTGGDRPLNEPLAAYAVDVSDPPNWVTGPQDKGTFAASGDAAAAKDALATASKKLDKAVAKGVIHANQAANKKSAMAKKAASL